MIRTSKTSDIPMCQNLILAMSEELPNVRDTKILETALNAISREQVILYFKGDVPVGFLSFTTGTLPDTDEHIFMERMLFVLPEYRKGIAAIRLIQFAEKFAKENGCKAIITGSSLNNNTAAQRIYNTLGYKTNYTFRKEI